MSRGVIRTFRDLEVYQFAYQLAMEIFSLTKRFPEHEVYALTRQLRNSARSVPANIAEGWSKRRYENVFRRQLVDAIGSVDEVTVWLDMARDCEYCDVTKHTELCERYASVGKMLYRLLEAWRTFDGTKTQA
ncbi:MAG: four helix bundle protein [Candidatus Omnitrophica bacterium]|nr:four helix bundle protein [Candidatus Omnitrophota bacterium]